MKTLLRISIVSILGTAFVLLVPNFALSQTTVYYLPQGYPDVCAWDLTHGGPACEAGVTDRRRRFCSEELTGLDLARQALGLATCPEESERASIPGVDYVFLVDDRSLSLDMRAVLGDAIRDFGDGPRVFPTRTADSVTPRRIIVGETMYRDRVNNRAEWLTQVGSLLSLEVDEQELGVEYAAAYPEFRRAVEDALCPIMLCRSDGRERMRTLIDRVEAQLRQVHTDASSFSGGDVPVRVLLYRQPDRRDRIDRLGFALGTEVDFGDEEGSVTAERPSAGPVLDDVEEDMTTSAGTRPPSARGDERYAVALPYMAHLTAYSVTMVWLTDPNTPVDGEALPTRRPAHSNGCAAPEQQRPNREGCEAALSHWREMEAGQRRLLRMRENRAELRRRLSEQYCQDFDHFCEGCSCDTRF